jgi:predicted dehydrogenase
MADTVDGAGIANQVGLILRRSPAFSMIRELARDPEHGRVMSVIFRDDQYIPIRGNYRSTWRADVAKAGAGTLLEHSIHDIDMIEWIAGPIHAATARKANFHQLEGIEDVMSATLELEDGGYASLTSVWHDIDARPSSRRIEVFCERAYIEMEGDWYGPVKWTTPDGEHHELGGDELVARVQQERGEDLNPNGAFLRAIAQGQPCSPDFRVAVRAHEITEAIYASAAGGGDTKTVG